MGLVDWASQGFIPMEFHVHLNMLFWLQSGKVDCWKFNQGFEKSELKGLYAEKNSQGASFKSSRGSAKLSALRWPIHRHNCTSPPSHRALLVLHCVFMYHISVCFIESYSPFKWKKRILHCVSQGSAGYIHVCPKNFETRMVAWRLEGMEETLSWRVTVSTE